MERLHVESYSSDMCRSAAEFDDLPLEKQMQIERVGHNAVKAFDSFFERDWLLRTRMPDME